MVPVGSWFKTFNKGEEMIKYIAVEKDTPDVPRAWGEGETDLIARYQCH